MSSLEDEGPREMHFPKKKKKKKNEKKNEKMKERKKYNIYIYIYIAVTAPPQGGQMGVVPESILFIY
jgi:hypothetical protein